MIDVSSKSTTLRTARTEARLKVSAATLARLKGGTLPKGDPLPVAKVAAIQAAKNTSQIIPYCHPLPIEFVGVEFEVEADHIQVSVTVKAVAKTGVEMEALTAASVAALTLYDMMKMVDPGMEIEGVRLVEKRGGKSDLREAPVPPLRAGVLVVSDSVSSGNKEDRSGRLIAERLEKEGIAVRQRATLPDEPDQVRALLLRWSDEERLDLILTTGGTGFGPRDQTPEAMEGLFEREAPGLSEALRAFGQERTPFAMLSRGRAGVRGASVVVNLPGSQKAAADALQALFPGILHAAGMLRGEGHGS